MRSSWIPQMPSLPLIIKAKDFEPEGKILGLELSELVHMYSMSHDPPNQRLFSHLRFNVHV